MVSPRCATSGERNVRRKATYLNRSDAQPDEVQQLIAERYRRRNLLRQGRVDPKSGQQQQRQRRQDDKRWTNGDGQASDAHTLEQRPTQGRAVADVDESRQGSPERCWPVVGGETDARHGELMLVEGQEARAGV